MVDRRLYNLVPMLNTLSRHVFASSNSLFNTPMGNSLKEDMSWLNTGAISTNLQYGRMQRN